MPEKPKKPKPPPGKKPPHWRQLMGAPTERYIDPLNGDDGTGDGLSDGTAWKTLQFALDNTTRDTTNGNRFNVKDSATDTLAAALDLTTFTKVNAPNAPCIIQGYTSTAGDGGIGTLSGGGSVAIINDTGVQWCHVIDMHLTNCGAAAAIWRVSIGDVLRCEVDTGTGSWGINVGNFSNVVGCYVHDVTQLCIGGVNNGEIAYNFCHNSGDNASTQGIDPGTGAVIHHNIVKLTAAGNQGMGIRIGATHKRVFNNSIWSNAGIGTGIIAETDTTNHMCYNNLIEGFSGTGGKGIDTTKSHGSPNRIAGFFNNSVFNCETAFDLDDHDEHFPFAGDETLSASPFNDVSNDDFTPVDTGSVYTGYLSTWPGPSGVVDPAPVRGALEPTTKGSSGGMICGGMVMPV